MSKAPHDLHHEKAADVKHIRLISEGGNSFAKSPEPVCIDSIQVNQTCTTESQHTIYPGNLASPHDNSLFSLPPKHALELDRCFIPAELRMRFKQQGITLSESARVVVHQAGSGWSISDLESQYTVRKLSAQLNVYRSAQ